jgi:hypothetical protein
MTGTGVLVEVGGGKVFVGSGVAVASGVTGTAVLVASMVGNGVKVAGIWPGGAVGEATSIMAVDSGGTMATTAVGVALPSEERTFCSTNTKTTARSITMTPPRIPTMIVNVLFIFPFPSFSRLPLSSGVL